MIFDDVEVPRERVFLDGDLDVYNRVRPRPACANIMNQTTIRALTKLEFAYGLAMPMAEAVNDRARRPRRCWGSSSSYVEVPATRSALGRARRRRGRRRVVPRRPTAPCPMRSLLATWFPRVNEIFMLIGSHNLLAAPSRRQLDDAELRPLIDEFLHGANGVDAEERAALFRLAWDFVGSGLAGPERALRALLPDLGGAQPHHPPLRHGDRARSDALVDGILAAGRRAGRLAGT